MQASRSVVATTISAYLMAQNVTNLSNVYPYPAKFTPEGDFYSGEDPGTQSGAMIFLRVARQSEKRMSLQGPTPGGKMVTYQVEMTIIFRSGTPKSQDVGAANDTFLDSLLTAIRASKTAGTSDGTIWQWGEGTQVGGADLDLEVFFPRPLAASQGVTQVNSLLKVTVEQYASQ